MGAPQSVHDKKYVRGLRQFGLTVLYILRIPSAFQPKALRYSPASEIGTDAETTLLLGASYDDDGDISTQDVKATSTSRGPLKIILLIATITLIFDIAGYASYAPQLEIFEKIICREYYAHEAQATKGGSIIDPRDYDCKIAPIQAELAILNGWKDGLDTIPGKFIDSNLQSQSLFTAINQATGILLALPFGALADRIGRKPVFLLGIFGCLLSDAYIKVICWISPVLPIRSIWFSSVFYLIGGGAQTGAALMYVMVADICPPDKRATAFSQLQAAALISEVVATPVSAALMSVDPWLPFLIGFGLTITGALLALLIPETLVIKQKARSTIPTGQVNEVAASSSEPTAPHSLVGSVWKELKILGHSAAGLWKDLNVILILVVFFVSYLGRQSVTLILQYASKRYHWTIAEASYLMSLRGSVNLLVLLVLLPAISVFLESRHSFSTARKDKILTQASLCLLCVGLLVIAFAFRPALIFLGLIIFALGSAIVVTARSLIADLVEKERLGTVFSAIGVATSAGMLVAGPLLANAYRWGLYLGTFWMGLPFLTASVLYIIALISVSFTKVSNVIRTS
ncbi:ATP synthase F0 [Phlyctema vagabunda]|uniref:ATP synthase F0 n=1 Tax=Phlyctema vagabunda TaxID=108571 RepID=A0ABR4PDU0_9HELO